MLITSYMIDEKLTLAFIVFLLGIRHGFELDHLAVIDGMISCTPTYSRLSRWIGFLFSLGHSSIVVLLTIIIAIGAKQWTIPNWLEWLGIWISIVFLIFFGLYSLYITFKKNQHELPMKFFGPKAFLLNHRCMQKNNSSFLIPVFVGILFSLSFDTLSVTTVFSLNGYALGGPALPIILGFTFMFGMMVTDGLNGYFIARLLHQADKRSRSVSRILDLGLGVFSLLLGSIYLVSYFR